MVIKGLIKIINRNIEMMEIKRIINAAQKKNPPKNEMQKECDLVFIRRLEENREALRLSFWENHFEWKAVLDYTEIMGRVLDFGCGSGHSDIFLARNGLTVHGVDLSPIGIAMANALIDKEDKAIQSRISFSVSDVIIDEPGGELYDSAWSSHVFEHIVDPNPILSGLKRWLKQGAPLLISVPLGNAYDDPSHVNHFFSGEELVEFLGQNVYVKKIDICKRYEIIRALCYFMY